MSKPPLPEAAVAMLRKPNPAVITTLRPGGQPVSVATWYLWDGGRVLVNMDEGRKRLENLRNDPRVALDVLDEMVSCAARGSSRADRAKPAGHSMTAPTGHAPGGESAGQ
jgi:hypothetical protein